MRALLCLLVALIVATPTVAHEGHDHDKPAPLALPVAPRVTAVTPDFELVGVRSGKTRLTIFLTSFSTGEPVAGTKLLVDASGEQAEAIEQDDGVFELNAPFLGTTSGLDLVFSLTLADGSQDLLTGRLEPPGDASQPAVATKATQETSPRALMPLLVGAVAGALTVLLFRPRRRHDHPTARDESAPTSTEKVRRIAVVAFAAVATAFLGGAARAAEQAGTPSIPSTMATDLAQRLPDGTLFVPKATQHLLSVRTMLVAESDIAKSVELTGTVIPSPNSFGRVQSPHSGRLEAPENGLAHIGQHVTKGDLLAYLTPHIGPVERGTVQSQIAEADARIVMQNARLARLRAAKLAVPPIKIDEAEGELAALQERRRELNPALSERYEIRAPVSGVVSKAGFYAGQILEPRDVLFEIVDPSEFWIEAAAFDLAIDAEHGTSTAVLGSGKAIPLHYAGRGLALREQAAPILFRLTEGLDQIAIGQPVEVVIKGTPSGKGFVAPSASIVRGSNGLPIVWVKADAERFEPRTVQTAPLDGQNVVVTAGVKGEMRIVTDGVTLLNQVR
ncbi:MAG: efflux RND transporter periplasmic adaptor subunit [Hyphomicrobiaceae bacterium]|nr:efflux RND transporter periplasmic adaptor subunit [Hyphomicrobiaceae bacterium]